jgi:hypothetical protein
VKKFDRDRHVVGGEKPEITIPAEEICIGHLDDHLTGGRIQVVDQPVDGPPTD